MRGIPIGADFARIALREYLYTVNGKAVLSLPGLNGHFINCGGEGFNYTTCSKIHMNLNKKGIKEKVSKYWYSDT